MDLKTKGSQYILYGAGKRCHELCEIASESDINIVAIVDGDSKKWGQLIGNYTVESPESILTYENSIICITVVDENAQEQIRTYIKSMAQQSISEISYLALLLEMYKSNIRIKESILNNEINDRQSILLDSLIGFNMGGAEVWLMSVYNELIKQNEKDVYIISNNGSYEIEKNLGDNLIKTKVEYAGCFLFEEVLDTAKKISQHLPCTVVTMMVDEVMLAAYLVKLFYPNSVKIISSVLNSFEMEYKRHYVFRECNDLYVAVSQDIVENMKKIAPSKEVYFMNLPFECPAILKRGYHLIKQEPIKIGSVGRVVIVQKRIDLLIKVIEELEEKLVNYEMEIVGRGIDFDFLQNELSKKGLLRKVKLLGELPRKQLIEFWKDKDIYINVSDFEGNCTAKLEAMGSGVVPVVTNTSGTTETILDGENGFVVDVGDYKTIAQRIKYLADHRELLEPMGRRAHEAVISKSSMEKHMELWNELLFNE